MKSLLLLLMLAVPSAAAIGQTSGITVWPKGVPPQGLTYKADFGDHILSISHREHSGRVEIHQTKVDVLVIQSAQLRSFQEACRSIPSAQLRTSYRHPASRAA